jgi:hypothetical protein
MGAEVPVFVKVLKPHVEWVEVSAVTLSEAMEKARSLPDITWVMGAQYNPPEED